MRITTSRPAPKLLHFSGAQSTRSRAPWGGPIPSRRSPTSGRPRYHAGAEGLLNLPRGLVVVVPSARRMGAWLFARRLAHIIGAGQDNLARRRHTASVIRCARPRVLSLFARLALLAWLVRNASPCLAAAAPRPRPERVHVAIGRGRGVGHRQWFSRHQHCASVLLQPPGPPGPCRPQVIPCFFPHPTRCGC